MLQGREITILGAGIAGLAAAVALALRGASVRVVERAPAITGAGAGIQVGPNGFRVLGALGLGDAAAQVGTVADAVRLCSHRKGRQVLRIDLGRRPDRVPWLFLHRADLIGLLHDAALGAGAAIELGREVVEIRETAAGAWLVHADGSSEGAALLVGADGLKSRLCPVLNRMTQPAFTGQVAWRALVSAPNDIAPEACVFMGPGRHCVLYPLAKRRLLNIVAIKERTEWIGESWTQPGDPDELRHAFAGFAPAVTDRLAGVVSCQLWGLWRHQVAKAWYGRHSVLIGDAVHPTLPFLAQGASMALEDAWVLAAVLDRHDGQDGLAAFQAMRQARVRRIVAAADANARYYHLGGLKRMVAHSLLRLGGRVAPNAPLRRLAWIYDHDATLI